MPRATGGAAGYIRQLILRYLTVAADISGTSALTLVGPITPGYTSEVEEFGFIPHTTLTGGPQTFTLQDGSSNVIATLVVAATSPKAVPVKTTTIVEAYREVRDTTTLSIKLTASGTGISAGGGEFYVKARQRPQARN